MSSPADLKEYQTIVEESYRELLQSYKKSIDNGDTYEYDSESFKGPFDNLATIAFPKAEPTILGATISSLEMYDDLLGLERASIIGELSRDDYYEAMSTDIDTELEYLDNRSALFQKHFNLLDKYKNS